MEKRILRLKDRKQESERLREKVALPVYSTVDERVEKQADSLLLGEEPKTPSCKPGCAACCFQVVIITSGEAMALAKHIVNAWSAGEIKKLCADLEKQSEALLQHDRAEWFRTYTPCPFLRRAPLPKTVVPPPNVEQRWQGVCKVYNHRPISCRAHLVVSAPQACAPDRQTEEVVESLSIAETERKATHIMQNAGFAMLGRRWSAPIQPAVLWCLLWIIDGRWPTNNEINKWLHRIAEWSGPPALATPAEEPQAEQA